MDSQRVIRFGFYTSYPETVRSFLSNKMKIQGQIILMVADYFVHHSKKFDDAFLTITNDPSIPLQNGSYLGIQGLINRSEIDIGFPPYRMDNYTLETNAMDFSYPFELGSYSFCTYKPDYKPRIFGIFETFSKTLWLAILISMIMLMAVHYFIMKRRYSFDKFFLHVLAVGVRQSSVLTPFSRGEKLLVYTWVVGAMFLCLAFDSVFLGFLAFPPVLEINNLQELAKAVSNGEYRVMGKPGILTSDMLLSEDKNLNNLAKDVVRNSEDKYFLENVWESKNFAIIMQTDLIQMFSEEFIISEDRFIHHVAAIVVRKNFCCKKLLESLVHRLMASGIFFKCTRDGMFLTGISSFFRDMRKTSVNKKLTIIDVASPFIFLLTGYFISIMVFIGEIWSYHKKKSQAIRKKNKKKKILVDNSI